MSTYYPNVTDITLAASLNVQPGNEISGIDLSISRQQLYRIRGRIIDARTDKPPQAATLTISSRSLGGGGFLMTSGPNTRYNNADGRATARHGSRLVWHRRSGNGYVRSIASVAIVTAKPTSSSGCCDCGQR